MAHETKHGGVLAMAVVDGVHLHVEAVVQTDGKVSLYASDAHGAVIAPTDVSGTVTCEPSDMQAKARVTLNPNNASGAVEANCAALRAPTTVITYDLTIRGTGMEETLKVPPGGTKALAGSKSAGHADQHDDDAHHHDHGH